jgi:integrase/recombinase XerD
MAKSRVIGPPSLKPQAWPLAVRLAWDEVRRGHGRLTRGGSAAHLCSIFQDDLARRYGQFLEHVLRVTGRLEASDRPACHVTPAHVATYVVELQSRVSSVTVHGSIAKLRCMAQYLAPGTDFGWLRDIENDLAFEMKPASKFGRFAPSDKIVLAGLTLMEEAETIRTGTSLQRAQSFRNGLMIALLALCPIRLKNLSNLILDKHLVRVGDNWCIALSAKETKERRPDERPIPAQLTPWMNLYLGAYRPIFGYSGSALWVGRYGKPLSYLGVERIVTETTRITLGIAMSPHQFRTSAASAAYMHAGSNPNLASALLNHRDPKITQDHYNRSRSAFYGREFQKLLDNLP